ncbi:MAG: hypothetical protein JNK90_18210 [Planctomycetaceae bacterium]|nr:hypothetical protein [Planctomycetaceae bacterium]
MIFFEVVRTIIAAIRLYLDYRKDRRETAVERRSQEMPSVTPTVEVRQKKEET